MLLSSASSFWLATPTLNMLSLMLLLYVALSLEFELF